MREEFPLDFFLDHRMPNQTWRVGDVEITKLVEVEFTFPSDDTGKLIPDADAASVLAIPWIGPFATPEGKLRGSVHLLLLQTKSARIIVDTGIGNDKARALPLFSMRTTPVLDYLHATGWSEESVNHVICTHLHLDHVGWNTVRRDSTWIPTFSHAIYHFASADYEYLDGSTNPARRAMFADLSHQLSLQILRLSMLQEPSPFRNLLRSRYRVTHPVNTALSCNRAVNAP